MTCFLSRRYGTGYQNNCSSNTTVRKRKPCIWFSRWKELSGYRLLFLRVLTKAHHASQKNDNALCFSAFYTARYGFKVCMRLYLNGDGVGKGTHISLFFVIMKGEYDAILSWPFRHKVKRYNQAVNQWTNQSFSEHLCCLLANDDAYIANSYIKGVISWQIKLSLIFWNRKLWCIMKFYCRYIELKCKWGTQNVLPSPVRQFVQIIWIWMLSLE